MRLVHDVAATSALRAHGSDGTPITIRRTGVLNAYWLSTVLGDGARLGTGTRLDVAFGADVPDDAIAGAVLRLLALSARGVEVTITLRTPDAADSAVVRWHARRVPARTQQVAHG